MEIRLRMWHSWLVEWHIIESFLVMPAYHSDLYPPKSSWWAEYECPYLLFIPTPVLFTYYGEMFRHGGDDDIQLGITPTISKFVHLTAVQFSHHAADGAAPDYCVLSLRSDHVEGGILFWMLSPSVNILSHFGFTRFSRSCVWILYLWRSRFIGWLKFTCTHGGQTSLWSMNSVWAWSAVTQLRYFLVSNVRKLMMAPLRWCFSLILILIAYQMWLTTRYQMFNVITDGTVLYLTTMVVFQVIFWLKLLMTLMLTLHWLCFGKPAVLLPFGLGTVFQSHGFATAFKDYSALKFRVRWPHPEFRWWCSVLAFRHHNSQEKGLATELVGIYVQEAGKWCP